MRLAILADIHGNLPALEAVLNDIGQPAPDGVIVAVDFIGGPQPNETIGLLCSRPGWMIRGNSDENVLRYTAGKAPAARWFRMPHGIRPPTHFPGRDHGVIAIEGRMPNSHG